MEQKSKQKTGKKGHDRARQALSFSSQIDNDVRLKLTRLTIEKTGKPSSFGSQTDNNVKLKLTRLTTENSSR